MPLLYHHIITLHTCLIAQARNCFWYGSSGMSISGGGSSMSCGTEWEGTRSGVGLQRDFILLQTKVLIGTHVWPCGPC